MRVLEIFCGTKSFSKVAEKKGYYSVSIENDPQFNPTILKDFMEIDPYQLKKDFGYFDIIWASPPCQGFCIPAVRYHWLDGKPISETSKMGLKLLTQTIAFIQILRPKYWFIENPMAMMRKQLIWDIIPHERTTVTYCQYGDTAMKPTDIFHNLYGWKGKRCKNGDPCHVSAPRGSRTIGSTQGKKNAKERGIIPPLLFEEIFNEIENRDE